MEEEHSIKKMRMRGYLNQLTQVLEIQPVKYLASPLSPWNSNDSRPSVPLQQGIRVDISQGLGTPLPSLRPFGPGLRRDCRMSSFPAKYQIKLS